MILVACDPGLTGAYSLYDTRRGSLEIFDMPVYERQVAKTRRMFIDEQGIHNLLLGFSVIGATHFVIEEVGGMPRQSAPNAFKFATSYYTSIATARCFGMAIERVRPAVWKAKMRVPADKSQARARASELMPELAYRWPKVKHDGRAEAALLALWAQQTFEGKRRVRK